MMGSVLERIALRVSHQLKRRMKNVSLEDLRTQIQKQSFVPKNFCETFLPNSVSVIAEIKFQSPSQGVLDSRSSTQAAVKIAGDYLQAGACALSVLTEEESFGGRQEYLSAVRGAYPESYLLMKDFIIHEYQLLEGRLAGADAALLIAAMLGPSKAENLYAKAQSLGLTVLFEVHDEKEMELAAHLGVNLIGVNNRNLKTLKVSLDVSRKLAGLAPKGAILICESGIEGPQQIREMRALGYSGFLIGTSLMKSGHPGQALKKILEVP